MLAATIRETTRWRLALLLTSTLASGAAPGCSFATVDGPPADHASRRYFDCTSGNVAPTVDLVLGSLIAIGMFGAGNSSDGSPDGKTFIEGTGVVALALASATYGYVRASQCRDAKEALSERLLAPPALPLGLAPLPPGALGPAVSTAGGTPPAAGRGDPWLQEGAPPAAAWGGGPLQPAASPPAVPPPVPAAIAPGAPAPIPDAGAPAPAGSER